MNVRVVGLIQDGKVEALLLKTTDHLSHSFVLRSTEKRYEAWHIASHSHVTVDGHFYRVAVLAPFEASDSMPVFATRRLPMAGELLEVLSMTDYLESRK